MVDEKKQGKQKRRTVSAARLYWAIIDATDSYGLATTAPVDDLLAELKDDIVEAAR